MRLEKHNQVVLSTYKKEKVSWLLVCQVKTTCSAALRQTMMSFYSLYNARKDAYVFLHRYLKLASSCARVIRRTTRLEQKSLPSTPDARDRGQGIPNPWFTGPPNFPFNYSSKKRSSYGLERWKQNKHP